MTGKPVARGPDFVTDPDCALIVLTDDGIVDLVYLIPQEIWDQVKWGRASLMPTSSASVELLTLILSVPDSPYMQPFTIVIIIIVWLLMLWCTENETSMYHLIELRLPPSWIKGRWQLMWRYLQVRGSFYQSWMFGDCTIVVRYDNSGKILGWLLLASNRSCIAWW